MGTYCPLRFHLSSFIQNGDIVWIVLLNCSIKESSKYRSIWSKYKLKKQNKPFGSEHPLDKTDVFSVPEFIFFKILHWKFSRLLHSVYECLCVQQSDNTLSSWIYCFEMSIFLRTRDATVIPEWLFIPGMHWWKVLLCELITHALKGYEGRMRCSRIDSNKWSTCTSIRIIRCDKSSLFIYQKICLGGLCSLLMYHMAHSIIKPSFWQAPQLHGANSPACSLIKKQEAWWLTGLAGELP